MEDGCINTDEQGNIETFGLNLAAIAVVAAGYGGYMDEELANALLDDMDFDRYGRVKCRKIEGMLPKLMKMVEGEERIRDKLDGEAGEDREKGDALRICAGRGGCEDRECLKR